MDYMDLAMRDCGAWKCGLFPSGKWRREREDVDSHFLAFLVFETSKSVFLAVHLTGHDNVVYNCLHFVLKVWVVRTEVWCEYVFLGVNNFCASWRQCLEEGRGNVLSQSLLEWRIQFCFFAVLTRSASTFRPQLLESIEAERWNIQQDADEVFL